MVNTPSTNATRAPARIAVSRPITGLLVREPAIAALNAPASSWLSIAMFTTPARSPITPPRAPNTRGTARRTAPPMSRTTGKSRSLPAPAHERKATRRTLAKTTESQMGTLFAADVQHRPGGRDHSEGDTHPGEGHARHRDTGDLEELALRGEAVPHVPGAGSEQQEEHEQRGDHTERDRCLAAGHGDAPDLVELRRGNGGSGDGGHAVTAFGSRRTRRRRAGRTSGCGNRKTARTSGGAAMNSTINDCTTRTISIGTFWEACITEPPALNPPNRMAAASTPNGVDRPSSATVIASKPMPASMS